MQSRPPSSVPRVQTPGPPPGPPQGVPSRSKFTDRLLYTWERLRPSQQQAAWQMVENMRVTVAHEATRRRRRELLLSILILVVTVGDVVLMYLLLSAPAR